jgi:hypothetical protein
MRNMTNSAPTRRPIVVITEALSQRMDLALATDLAGAVLMALDFDGYEVMIRRSVLERDQSLS